MAQIPSDIIDWFRGIFSAANRRLAERIQNVPATPEPHLDTTLIEHLMAYSAPQVFPSGWGVRIDVHYLGGLRHFYGWEIADIGILVFFQRAGTLVRQKVALLQSKRLYPTSADIDHLEEYDFRIGMSRLGQRDRFAPSMMSQRLFAFEEGSRYRALSAHNDQYQAIADFISQRKIPVFYLFYNPPLVPLHVQVPITDYVMINSDPPLGSRVIPYQDVAGVLNAKKSGYSPSIADLAREDGISAHGWRLEYFAADLLLTCQEGHRFTDANSPEMEALFFRRSGPIAATIAVTIEMPEGTEFLE